MADCGQHANGGEAQTPNTDNRNPFFVANRTELGDCGIRRQAGARQSSPPERIDTCYVNEIARMRHDKVIGVSAATLDADHLRLHAILIHAFATTHARPAADPWV